MEFLQEKHDFGNGSLLGLGAGFVEHCRAQVDQPRIDFLQRFQFVGTEGGDAPGLAHPSRQLLGEFDEGPTPLGAGQDGLVVDTVGATGDAGLVLLDQQLEVVVLGLGPRV